MYLFECVCRIDLDNLASVLVEHCVAKLARDLRSLFSLLLRALKLQVIFDNFLPSSFLVELNGGRVGLD